MYKASYIFKRKRSSAVLNEVWVRDKELNELNCQNNVVVLLQTIVSYFPLRALTVYI